MSNNFFTICSLFYIILLNVVYFRKNRADNYETKIYQNIRKQLEEAIYQRCYVCFLNQIKLLIPYIQKFMRSSLKNALKKGKIYN